MKCCVISSSRQFQENGEKCCPKILFCCTMSIVFKTWISGVEKSFLKQTSPFKASFGLLECAFRGRIRAKTTRKVAKSADFWRRAVSKTLGILESFPPGSRVFQKSQNWPKRTRNLTLKPLASTLNITASNLLQHFRSQKEQDKSNEERHKYQNSYSQIKFNESIFVFRNDIIKKEEMRETWSRETDSALEFNKRVIENLDQRVSRTLENLFYLPTPFASQFFSGFDVYAYMTKHPREKKNLHAELGHKTRAKWSAAFHFQFDIFIA